MKKICLFLAVVMLISSILIITSFAATETVSWGTQRDLVQVPEYAVFDRSNESFDQVYHNYNSVGFTYRDARCSESTPNIMFYIQKKGNWGVWETKSTSIGPVQNTVELGYGGPYGSGTYRFYLMPLDNTIENDYGITTDYIPITIMEFFSKSSSETSRTISWNLSESE